MISSRTVALSRADVFLAIAPTHFHVESSPAARRGGSVGPGRLVDETLRMTNLNGNPKLDASAHEGYRLFWGVVLSFFLLVILIWMVCIYCATKLGLPADISLDARGNVVGALPRVCLRSGSDPCDVLISRTLSISPAGAREHRFHSDR
jgi:hypothetical protein